MGIGSAYIDIGDTEGLKGDQAQLGFLFMMLQTAAMAAFMNLSALISQRDIMKLEVAEGLYTEGAHIVSSFIIGTPVAVVEHTAFFVIMFAMGGLDWDVFGNLYGFGLLLAIAMDAFFAMSAAVSKTSDQAMQIAMPFLFLFVIYNGFLVTKETCPYYFKWILYTSPIAWVFEQIGIGTYEDHDNFDELVEQYGWITSKGHKWACIGVLLGMFCLFKFGEMLGLKYLHAHQR